MPIISIIVPIYNAEKYLYRCIDSILAQSFTDFELLLIDDGSTDKSGRICDEYIQKDFRVRVFHKENGGVSSARNLGLDYAKGKWIAFVDSDDEVSELYLFNLISHAQNRKVDLVISYSVMQDSLGNRVKEKYPENLIEDDYSLLFSCNELNWHTSPWSKLFKSSLCKELRFVEGMHLGEDLVFLYTYMLACNSIFVSNDTDYIYNFENQTSLTKRINKLDAELFGYNKVVDAINRLIEVKHINDNVTKLKLGWIIAFYVGRVLNSLYHNSNITHIERLKIIKSLSIERYVNLISPSSLKEHFLCLLLKFGLYSLYDFIRIIKVKLDSNIYV